MKTAILIHGTCDHGEYFSDKYPSLSNSHWFPWLQKQLLMHGYLAQAPEMPNPVRPKYSDWKAMFERFPINGDTILIGHSCGGGFLTRWMSELPARAAKLILVAPWIDPTGYKDPEFFDFKIDPKLTDRSDVHIVSSDNDMPDIMQSVEMITTALPAAKLHKFLGYGHFCFKDMQTDQFPELRDIVLAR
jgi:predicted alpha/beta hydrolase family esterase